MKDIDKEQFRPSGESFLEQLKMSYLRFLKMGQPWPLFNLFLPFQTHTLHFYNKKCIWCRDSNSQPLKHESPPITSRPGLQPDTFSYYPAYWVAEKVPNLLLLKCSMVYHLNNSCCIPPPPRKNLLSHARKGFTLPESKAFTVKIVLKS